jgi:hypothetical protein
LNTVYHAAVLLSQSTQVGVGFGTDDAGIPMCAVDLGAASGTAYPQVAATGSRTAYPYDGQTKVLDAFYVAYETLRPAATLFPNLTAGTPVVVNLRNADYVNAQNAGTLSAVVTAFTIEDDGGSSVPAVLSNPALTGGPGVTLNADSKLSDGFAMLVPLSPLPKGSTYTATYTATFTATLKAGSAPVTETWAFVTNP